MNNKMSYHKRVSYVKSVLRLVGYALGVVYGMIYGWQFLLIECFSLLMLAEVLGILEEIDE